MQDEGRERLILVVDPHATHVDTIQRVLNGDRHKYQLQAIPDGQTALDFLYRRPPYGEAPRPDLILLDLDLPGKDGREVLTTLKANSQLKRIPVIVFTLTDRTEDIFRSYSNQGNCYVLKSYDLDQLSLIVQRIEDFWLEIVTLPGE